MLTSSFGHTIQIIIQSILQLDFNRLIKLIMAQLLEFLEQPSLKLLCDRNGLHVEQPLDLVCLDPFCRNNPLGCSVCFDEIHKFHKVVPLSKFLSEYKRNSKKFNRKHLNRQIEQAHQQALQISRSLKQRFNKSIEDFQSSIQKYRQFLRNELEVKYEISRQFGVELDTAKMKKLSSLSDLKKSVKFVLNNSVFDVDNNMVDISELLHSNNTRILALASKLQYMTIDCERTIEQAIKKFNFANNTIRQQKVTALVNLQNSEYQLKDYGLKRLNQRLSKKYYCEFENLVKDTTINKMNSTFINDKELTLQTTASPIKKRSVTQQDIQNLTMNMKDRQMKISFKFFGLKNSNLTVSNHNSNVKSNINAMIPQYILAQPQVEIKPAKVTTWAIKILKCRNFSCLNTIGIGLAHKKKLQDNKYQIKANEFKDCYLVNSQGDIFLPTKSYKDKHFRFSEGQTVYFKYDPFYHQLEIRRQKGNTLIIRTNPILQDGLYICARLTYASDEVQILN